MDVPNLLGWLAASLVLTSFCLRTIVPLRLVALASNLAFIAYGLQVGATPIFILHSLLLPLNILRLAQIWRLHRMVNSAAGTTTMEAALLPHMRPTRARAGETVFHKGQPSGEVFYLIKGRARAVTTGAMYLPGDLFGELDAFSPRARHLDTVICETDVVLGVISSNQICEILYRQPGLSPLLLRKLAGEVANKLNRTAGAVGGTLRHNPF